MAGSRAWYNYTADNDTVYAVELDENTGSINTSGFTPYTGQVVSTTLPSGWKMRYVNAVVTNGEGAGFVSRRIPVGTRTAALYTGAQTTVTIGAQIYAVSSAIGEKQRRPKALPSGLKGLGDTVGEGEP